MKKGYLAYEVPLLVRDELLQKFPPHFPEIIGHHITLVYGIPKPEQCPTSVADVRVVGWAKSVGIEAFVVEVNGSIEREDGFLFHITWSLDRSLGKKPVDAKQVISEGFTLIEQPISFKAPLRFFY